MIYISVLMKASIKPYTLNFNFQAETSRGILTQKETYFLKVDSNGKIGIGECSPLWGLSIDDRENFLPKLEEVRSDLAHFNLPENPEQAFDFAEKYIDFPAIRMGVEMALLEMMNGNHVYFASEFLKNTPIEINGLIWMGDRVEMMERAMEKMTQKFNVLKMKIGAIGFDDEVQILQKIREERPDLILRVDANGGFGSTEIFEVLQELDKIGIHSIEQPIEKGNIDMMAQLCHESPIPIALDEELIGCRNKLELLREVKPQYLVLKPSLLGGFKETREWIDHCKKFNTNWWITSALESNVGLSAIAQFTSLYDNGMVHGLGTGSLYSNNITSPLEVNEGYLYYGKTSWDFTVLE